MRRSLEAEAKAGICSQVEGQVEDQVGSRARGEDRLMGVGVTGRKGLAKLFWWARLGKKNCDGQLFFTGKAVYN
jgi:hypothetical protein